MATNSRLWTSVVDFLEFLVNLGPLRVIFRPVGVDFKLWESILAAGSRCWTCGTRFLTSLCQGSWESILGLWDSFLFFWGLI